MAASPKYKVYNSDGEYQGSVKDSVLAVVMVGFLGDGATIRLGHDKRFTVYTQGIDPDGAESYDVADAAIQTREAGFTEVR